jgi:processive 1,2-diacylglycerol beta-glucosyltransferase
MIEIYNNKTGEPIGEITREQLQFLIDAMEEESLEDQDYSITAMELMSFEGDGADPALIALLRGALGDQKELVIRWELE